MKSPFFGYEIGSSGYSRFNVCCAIESHLKEIGMEMAVLQKAPKADLKSHAILQELKLREQDLTAMLKELRRRGFEDDGQKSKTLAYA